MESALTVEYLVVTAGVVLAGVISKLWAELKKGQEKSDKELVEQKKTNREINSKVIDLSERVGHATGYKDGVDDIASALIRQVRGEK